MKSKLNLIIGIILISFIFSSCSDERLEQIEKIKTNTELSKTDKIINIADIAINNISGDSISYKIEKDEDGNDFLHVIILDKNFKFESTEQMKAVVRNDIAKYVWRFLHDTKDLGIDEIGIEFYGNINSDDGPIDALIYQVFGLRKDFTDITGFYETNPYKTGEYDVIEPGSEQQKIRDLVNDKMQILTNNSDQITF